MDFLVILAIVYAPLLVAVNGGAGWTALTFLCCSFVVVSLFSASAHRDCSVDHGVGMRYGFANRKRCSRLKIIGMLGSFRSQ
jgi:hypothetical protein